MMRIAIVGLGPKGLYALERLVDAAAHLDADESFEIDAFEPHPFPGSGPVYDPRQPEYLRMNFPADQIDVWRLGNGVVPIEEQRSFVEWRARRGGGDDQYPPRSEVGMYLAEALSVLRTHAPPNVRIRVVATTVRHMARGPQGWELAADGANSPYDEVLIATGHNADVGSASLGKWQHATKLVPQVFPVDVWLGSDHVPPGARVATRGFALSFIDAALALTEGRGGRFVTDDEGLTCRYCGVEDDVEVIFPVSRTGRPMLAKPAPDCSQIPSRAHERALTGRNQILALPSNASALTDLLAVIGDVAHTTGGERVALSEAVSRMTLNKPAPTLLSPRDELAQSLAIAQGRAQPDLGWALGYAWRALYPAIVERLGGDGMADEDWPRFRFLATHMERLAFGPPPINVAKLLALIDAGKVDLSHVDGSRSPLLSVHPIDVVINTVLAAPGVAGALLEQLVADGYASVRPGRRGLAVDADGNCIDSDGNRTVGLSAIGRPTEDSVIGNDTLSRTLHGLAGRWASRTCGAVQLA